MDVLTWTQLSSGDYQAEEYPLRLTQTVSHRGRHMWRLRVPHEPDPNYVGGWSWRDAHPHGTKSGPLEAAELDDVVHLVQQHLDVIVRSLPVERVRAPSLLDRDSPTPLHEQIAALLRNQILAGELGPGDKLPTNTQMAQYYGVGNKTAQSARAVLAEEGLVVTKVRGYTRAGSFVTHTRPRLRTLQVPVDADTSTLRAWALEHLGLTLTPTQAATVRAHLTHTNGNPNRGSL